MSRAVKRLAWCGAFAGTSMWLLGLGLVLGRQRWDAPTAADAVIVLGTRATVDGAPNPCMRIRVEAGARLIEAGLAPRLVVSGGMDPDDGTIEAEAMAAIASDLGVEPDRIVIEGSATSTIENLTYSVALLDPGARVIVVTEPFHLPRAMFAAARLGVDAQGAPSERCTERSLGWIVREPVASIWYRIKLR